MCCSPILQLTHLGDASMGGISSYALTLMLIHYLQQKGCLPNLQQVSWLFASLKCRMIDFHWYTVDIVCSEIKGDQIKGAANNMAVMLKQCRFVCSGRFYLTDIARANHTTHCSALELLVAHDPVPKLARLASRGQPLFVVLERQSSVITCSHEGDFVINSGLNQCGAILIIKRLLWSTWLRAVRFDNCERCCV